jgi:acrosin
MTRATKLFRAARLRPARPTTRRLALDSLEDRTTPAALVMNHYNALALAGTSGFVPPDTCGAAGTNRYVETVNQDVLLSNTLGTKLAQDSLSHFLYATGGLTPADGASFLSDPIVTWNDQYQRFIIGDQDVDFGSIGDVSKFHLAVSKTASPTTLSAADWSFYSIDTTENGGTANTTYDADYPGNFGYNHDAFVFTLNMFPLGTQGNRVQVNSVDLASLVGGTLTAYRNDVSGLFSLRPTVMHDSVNPGDPMWLVSHGAANQINVTKMTNVLSSTASFTTTPLAVNPYTDVHFAPPKNPDGSIITSNIDSRILKAAETGGMLVASHAVTDSAGDRVDARWYEINVNGAGPTLADQGSVSAGANTYSFYPGVDINAAGDIGMTFIRSSNIGAGSEYMSTYVTGRQATDVAGTMQTPVLTMAGAANNFDTRAGDLSGINVAPDGTFWSANEYATVDHSWGTDVQHFVLDGRPVINGDQTAAGNNDNIVVRIDGANPNLLDVYVNSATPTYSLPVADLKSLAVNGQGSTDTLTVDYSNGSIPVPIDYDGGPGTGDALTVTGYTGGTVRSTYTGPHAGKVVVGANGPITYKNLAPLALNGTAADLIFDLPAGPNPDATLSDDGGPGDPDATNDAGFSALSGSTFEYTEFANPSGSLTVNLGGSGDTLNLAPMDSGFAPLTVSVNGGAGSDTIVGDNAGRTFTITGANSGTAGWVVPVAFTNVENLVGGTGNDSFVFAGGSLTGTINGGAGSNTITGDNADDSFSITGASAGSIATLLPSGFSNVQNLVGGTGNDSFVFAGGSLTGTINGGAGTNTITGDSAGDSFAITGANAGSIATLLPSGFSNVQNLVGGTGADSFAFAGGSLTGTIDGGAGTNTITGDNAGDSFAITGTNAGSIATLLPAGFVNIGNLTGGTGNDTFTFVTGGSLTGAIDGGAGTNTITGDNAGDAFAITGANAGSIATLLAAGFVNIQNLVGGTGNDSFTFVTGGSLTGMIDGGAGTNTITGDNAGDLFVITGANAGAIVTLLPAGFVNIGNLVGETGNDEFVFAGGSLTGTINGGGGANGIAGDNAGDSFAITGPNAGSIATLIPAGFVNIGNLAGGTGNDSFTFVTGGSLTGTINGGAGTNTITGDNAGDAFSITGSNAGSIATLLSAGFTNVQNLVGGTGDDSFTFVTGGSLAGTINGGAGTNTVTGDNAGDAFSITGSNAGSIATLLSAGFVNIGNLAGGTGNDSFAFVTGGSLAGTINGGGGTNTVTGDNAGDTFAITGANAGSIATLLPAGFVNIENLVGGTGNDSFVFAGGTLAGNIDGGAGTDTLIGDNGGRTFTITGPNSGTVSTILGGTFGNVENLAGETGPDTFQFATGGTLSGNIDGGAGTDTLIGDDTGRTFTITGPNSGTVSGILGGSFTDVENLTGGAGNDTFVFAGGSLSGTINGGGGTNTIIGDNVGRTYTITGPDSGTISGIGSFAGIQSLTAGGGNDTFVFAGGSLAGTIDGGAGTNTLIGDNAGRAFAITGTNAGTVSTILSSGFVNIENLTGGTDNESFSFAAGGSLAGNIDGGGGTNTLVGDDTGRSFTVTGANSGTVGTILGGTFANIENLTGGAGGDTFQFANGGTLSGNVDGGAGTNTLIGDDGGRTVTVTGAGSGTLSVILGGTFANIENLTGGAGNDTFAFAGGNLVGNIDGGGGPNTLVGDDAGRTFTVTGANGGTLSAILGGAFANIENLTGGTGADTFQFNTGGSLSGNVDGGAGTNTLVGNDGGRTFTVTGANGGTVSTILGGTFANIENLTGGAGNDSFVFAGGSLAGNIDGGAGTNTLVGDNGGRAFTVSGANGGTVSNILGGTFANIENLTGGTGDDSFVFTGGSLAGNIDGGAGTDTIDGDGGGRTFTITGAGSGTLSTILGGTFTNVENLTGGAGADTFRFNNGGTLAGNIDGGAGTDTIVGDDGGRTFTITGAGSGTLSTILGGTFANVENLTGGAGNDTFQFTAPGLSGNIDGGGGTNTLVGDNSARTFTITGPNSGTVSGLLGGSFSNIENLTGGTGNDTFVFAGGSLTGTINGGGGNDTIVGDNTGRTYTISGPNSGTISGIGSFSNIPNLTGGTGNDTFVFANGGSLTGSINGGAGTDTIVGDDGGRTFTVTGAGSGTLSTILGGSFGAIENLTGGAGNDTFQFTAPGLSGNIDGGGGTNTLVGDNGGRTFTVNAANGGTVSTILGGTFANIENLTGGTGNDSFVFVSPGTLAGNINAGAGTDTLVADNGGRTFTVTGSGSGTLSTILGGTFSAIENLTGGTGNDSFVFVSPGTLSGNINGGAGNNTIAGDNGNRTYTITGTNAGTVGVLLGGTFANVENLTGGTGNDTFQFNGGGSLSGNIDGGAGNNTIAGDNGNRTYTITGTNAGTVGVLLGGTFANVENLTGGSGADTFRFANSGTLAGNIGGGLGADNLIADDGGRTFTLTGQDSGTLSTILGGTFSGINLLTGGAGNDRFVFANGGSLVGPGNIDGGAGNNTIVGDDGTRTFTVTGSNAGTVSTILAGTFANIQNLTGGAAADTFRFNDGGTLAGNIDGGAGNNSLTGDNTGRTYTINATNGGTVSVILGGTFSNIENLTGGSGNDTFQFVTPGTLAGNIDGGGGTNTVIGDNTGRTFTLTGANTGTISTILGGTFANIENLVGGSGGDTLVVLAAGSLTGSFDGQAGTDTVDLSAVLTAQSLTVTGTGSIDGFNVSGSPVAGGLLNINGLTASAANGDTLTGLNANTLWTLTGVNAGTYEDLTTTRTMAISGFENLSGGSANDQFVFANGGSLTGTVAGNGGTDTVQGDDGGRTFAVTGAGSGTVSGILLGGFTGIENLIGGAGADTLVVAAAGSLAGSFDGLAGTDTADLSALASQQIAATGLGAVGGFNTTGGTAIAGGLFNLDSLIGSLAGTTDSLTGLDSAGTYTVSAGNAGEYQDNTSARTLAFANVENLTGGAAADTLVVQAAGFLGGAFDGTGGYDTADLSALPAQSPVIANVGATDGYNLTGLSAVGGGLLNVNKIIGSAAATTDNLTGRNVAATWAVTAANAGQYVDVSTRTLDFTNFENLTGGTANDKLVMSVGGGLAGSFDGGLGVDTGDFSALGAQAFVVSSLGSADGFNVTGVPIVALGLKDVDALVGSTAGTTDSLTGMNNNSTYTVTGTNAGSYQDTASGRTLTFTQVKNLDGGMANDTLVVMIGGGLSGHFDGGAGTDTADLSNLTAVQSISVLALGGTDGFNTTGGTTVTGGLFNVDKVIGGKSASAVLGSSDRLTGLNADANWLVKAGTDQSFYQDVGSGRKLVFAGFEELYGGTQKDSVTVDFSAGNPLAANGLTVNGQGGSDSLNTVGAATRNVFTVGVKQFVVNGHAIRYKNMEKLSATGGAGNDVFNAPNVSLPSTVSRVEFYGMGGNDVATVSPTVLAVLHLDGGAGTNTLHVLNTGQHYLAPIPPKSAVDGTYFFSNRARLEFLNFGIRTIGITQPQP